MDLAKPYDEYRPEVRAMGDRIEAECPGTRFLMPEYGEWMEI